jgi:hypothetical protein
MIGPLGYAIGLLVVIAYVVVVMSYIHYPPTASGEILQVLSVLIGNLGNMAALVVGYYFGSSASANKGPAPAEPPKVPEGGVK